MLFFELAAVAPKNSHRQDCVGAVLGEKNNARLKAGQRLPEKEEIPSATIVARNSFSIISAIGNSSRTVAAGALLVGMIAYEIGDTLTLDHPKVPVAIPGGAIHDLIGTGVDPTNMPNAERIKDRAPFWTEFGQLITTVGMRGVPMTAVPEPKARAMSLTGSALLDFTLRRRRNMGLDQMGAMAA